MGASIRLVIFDLDGTLVHLPIDYEKLRHRISEVLRIGRVDTILDVFSKTDENARKRVFDVWSRLEMEALSGMTENARGIRLYNFFCDKVRCLVTLQGRQVVERILEETGLSFDHVVTREDSLSRVEQIRMVIDRFGVDPKDVLFIGDRESDREAAEKNGCLFMFVWEKEKF